MAINPITGEILNNRRMKTILTFGLCEGEQKEIERIVAERYEIVNCSDCFTYQVIDLMDDKTSFSSRLVEWWR